MEHPPKKLHIKTTLLKSPKMSRETGCNIYLKLENTQNSGSYKARGIGHYCQSAVKNGAKHLVCSSGGNAGLAAVFSANELGVPCTVVVPTVTAKFMQERIANEGGKVIPHGASWDEANQLAIEICKKEGGVLVHPFDGIDIWQGHSTIVDEMVEELGKNIDLVILSVGGGGLFNGVIQGLERNGLGQVPVLGMGTEGAQSFYECVTTGKHVTYNDLHSIAKTLSVKRVSDQTFEYIQKRGHVFARIVPDKLAVDACLKFAEDHKALVSPSAGASLAAVYDNIFKDLQTAGSIKKGALNVVVIVCGGSEINVKQLEEWRIKFGL